MSDYAAKSDLKTQQILIYGNLLKILIQLLKFTLFDLSQLFNVVKMMQFN